MCFFYSETYKCFYKCYEWCATEYQEIPEVINSSNVPLDVASGSNAASVEKIFANDDSLNAASNNKLFWCTSRSCKCFKCCISRENFCSCWFT